MKMRPDKIQCLRDLALLMCALLALDLAVEVKPSSAQQRSAVDRQNRKEDPDADSTRLRAQFEMATSEYKSNLEQLLAHYEADKKKAEEQLPMTKELFAQGLITRGELQRAEDVAARASDKVAGLKEQLKSADVQLAEMLVETKLEEAAPTVKPSVPTYSRGGLVHATAYIRYGGGRAWSLSETGAIKQFFMMRFGRALPIHVFGQSLLHDRWGYDHRNAMDIGLHPDSVEGEALMEYLRANGVPFTAFHFAIPGVATGPHIHVGLPSHRIAVAAGR